MSSSTETLTLSNGITRGDDTIHDISIRTPRAGDLRGLKMVDIMQGDVNSLAKLLPRVSSPALTEQEIYQFDFYDMGTVMEVLSVFMEPSPQSPSA